MVVDEDYYKNKNGNRISVEEFQQLSGEQQKEYTLVTSEEQFCYGIANARVVEIRVDLELGYKYLVKNNINTYGSVALVTDYEKGFEPITSPVLMEVGVSDVNVSSHTTIFSPNGSKIEHAGFRLNKVEDVVIRNLAFQGMYEWDDVPEGVDSPSPGGSKRYGWCYMSCNNAKGIWIDHCSFGYSFDGNIDLKNDAQVSVTWCQIGYQDTEIGPYTGTKDDYNYGCDLWKCILYMEEQYKAGNGFRIYKIFRDNGATMEQIFKYACVHHKVHLVGSGEDDYETNPLNAITLAYNQYKSVGSRIPKIRQGNGHMFNCYLDDEEYQNNCYGDKTFNEARRAVSEAKYSTNGISRCLDASCGASIGVDTCVFNGFRQAMTGSEKTGSGRFKDAINYQLIVNSSFNVYGSDEVYVGSSWDNKGENIFNANFIVNSGNSYMESKTWKWAEWKPMTKDKNLAVEGVEYVPESMVKNLKDGEFYERYYIGREELGYEYQTFKLEDVKKNTDLYSGPGKITFENSGEWTKLYYGQESDKHLVQFENGDFEGAKAQLYKENSALEELPVLTREGYKFLGWYQGKYQNVNGTYQLVYSEEPVNEETIVTEEMHLYDKWEIMKYTLAYESFGGGEIAPVTGIQYGTTIAGIGGFPKEPAREGFEFQGWYAYTSEKGFGAKYSKGNKITEDTTLYAKWKPDKIKVLFNNNGGSEVAAIDNVAYNSEITLPDEPVKEGYTFAGWFYDEAMTKEFKKSTKLTDKLSADINIYGTLTLYAKWTENQTEQLLMGDVTGDGLIDANDALLILKYVAKMETTLSEIQLKQADVEGGNGIVDANDALKILKFVAKMVTSFDEIPMAQGVLK